MSYTQFPNGTHFDSIVFSTEGPNPQVDNPWNGQAQTVTTGEIYGVGDVPAQYDQCFGQHDENTLYSYGDPYAALQNQLTQTNTFGPSNNISCMQNLQGTESDEEVLRRIHYVYGLPERYYPSSGRAPFPGEGNDSPVRMAVPATMGTVSTTSNGTSFEEDYFYFNLQAGNPLTLSNGLVSPLQTVASNVYSNQTACSSLVYPPSYNNAWATHPDKSTVEPKAQTVAPRMNTVTPCVVCCNDRGGASVGAAACAIAPAPGPTPGMNDNAHDKHPLSTASTNPPRDAENGSHRSRQKTQAPRAMGCNRTRRTISTPRGVPLSLAQTAKAPPVPYDADINTVAARLLNEGARPATVEVLRTQVFNNGVDERALNAKFIHMDRSTNLSRVKRKYLLLLEHSSDWYWCLLCPQDCPVKYKNAQDSLRHLRKDHFGLAFTCRCGCDHKFFRRSEMNQHLKKRNGFVSMGAGEQSGVHGETVEHSRRLF